MVRMSGGGMSSDPGVEGGSLLMSLEPWQILLITVAAAVILGLVIGVLVGKYQVKKASSDYKPLLSLKERIIYLTVFALGTGCILLGTFYTFPAPQVPDMAEGGMIEQNPDMVGGGMFEQNPDKAGDGMIEGSPDLVDGGEVIMPDDVVLEKSSEDNAVAENGVKESVEAVE